MALILEQAQDCIGTLTLNNDAKRNSLSEALLDELVYALARMKGQSLRVVILRANPRTKVWSAGHDIHELAKPGNDPLAYDDPLEKTIRAIQHFPAPVIAMIEGGVWGGACELAFSCDIRIGTTTTSFCITPAKIGVPYNLNGIMNLVNALGAATTREMIFTAQSLSAERAYQLGALHHLVASEELEAYTIDLARKICLNSPLSIAVIKEQLRILGGAHTLSPDSFERIQALRRVVYESGDYREGIDAFLQKRKPSFQGN